MRYRVPVPVRTRRLVEGLVGLDEAARDVPVAEDEKGERDAAAGGQADVSGEK